MFRTGPRARFRLKFHRGTHFNRCASLPSVLKVIFERELSSLSRATYPGKPHPGLFGTTLHATLSQHMGRRGAYGRVGWRNRPWYLSLNRHWAPYVAVFVSFRDGLAQASAWNWVQVLRALRMNVHKISSDKADLWCSQRCEVGEVEWERLPQGHPGSVKDLNLNLNPMPEPCHLPCLTTLCVLHG